MPCDIAINGISQARKGDQVVKSLPGSGRARIQARPSGPSEPHTGSRGHLATQGACGPANKKHSDDHPVRKLHLQSFRKHLISARKFTVYSFLNDRIEIEKKI